MNLATGPQAFSRALAPEHRARGFTRDFRAGCAEDRCKRFRFLALAGNRVSVRSDLAPKFEGREVARRARSRIGEANYRLFTNNCDLRSLASRTPLRSTQASAGRATGQRSS
jgi:hypothetical protein